MDTLLSTRKRLLATAPIAALAAALTLGSTPAVQAADPATTVAAKPAKPPKKKPAALKVMTQNLYLGASLDPVLEAGGDTVQLLQAVAEIYETAIASDFETRAGWVADTIAKQKPHVIGLQEVSKWSALRLKGEGEPLPTVDFLEVLLAELEERGLNYEVAVDGEGDEAIAQNANVGPAPLLLPHRGCEVRSGTDFDCGGSLGDRDVILVAAGAGVKITDVENGRYAEQQTFNGGPLGEISFGRGWTYADATYKGRKVRFANSHLEIGRFAPVQVKQAKEFLAGPAKVGKKRQLIATGDFNSAADGSSTRTYKILTKKLGDTWVQANGKKKKGNTCCQAPDLNNVEPALHERIDLILVKGTRGTAWSRVVGDQPFNTDPAHTGPRYAADHAGVVSKIRLR